MLSVLDTETFYIAAEVERVIKHAQSLSTQASLTTILYVTILVPSGCLVDSLDHILFKIIFIQVYYIRCFKSLRTLHSTVKPRFTAGFGERKHPG